MPKCANISTLEYNISRTKCPLFNNIYVFDPKLYLSNAFTLDKLKGSLPSGMNQLSA